MSSSNLLRSVRACRPTTYRSIRQQPSTSCNGNLAFHTAPVRKQETYQQRYGSAAEAHLPPPPRPKDDFLPKKQELAREGESNSDTAQQDQKDTSPSPASGTSSSKNVGEERAATSSDTRNVSSQQEAKEVKEEKAVTPLDIVLQAIQPSELYGEQHRHPHLAPSPYEHHFDTYSLVQDLAKGGFSEEQAVTIMKAIRLMLAENLDLAKDGLVSKSDVENETYLFRAACSELRTSLQTSRHSASQRQRTQRAQLHHEFDILNQKVTQDMLTLREELKAMFNDRKMAVQDEKRRLDSKISELGYEITVLLNSDSKSEVEGLRWVLTRRAAMAIAIAALMTLISLNYSSHVMRQKEEAEKKIAAAKKKAAERDEARYTTPARDQGTQTPSTFAESLG
ncbi:hypothetical protein GJ744_009176 [Endocarpon pusillum]|uniref:MOZ protein represents a chromatin-associated acetyltransferase n=1 Tax=Endocarpon pusillum TaxID=364733 RepID=A0A8H7AGC0_9EURO|nr:hypothetical protein GJ744_009176 [Endocarpon pusillum]